MKTIDAKHFHQMYGLKRGRVNYREKDFIDYTLMIVLSAGVVWLVYGIDNPLGWLALTLCGVLIPTFLLRHGVEAQVPLVLRRPQDLLYMLVYKLRNVQPIFLFALAVLVLENYLISVTPEWPHRTELARTIALYLFYAHFLVITIFRTVILVDHVRKAGHVREVLLQTYWKAQVERSPSIVLEIFHAYFTGLLTHILLIAPWFIAITHLKYSLVLLPAVVLVNFMTHAKFMRRLNYWFYRDHWLGHNSEIEFIYLHGSHHDAIPCGLIGVSGNGFIEGVFRHLMGHPTALYNPLVSMLIYTAEIAFDIRGHQYIPGVFPRIANHFYRSNQHSTHHYGRLEPYSIGFKFSAYRTAKGQPSARESEGFQKFIKMVPSEIANSAGLDEQLTGFEWDNPTHQKILDLCDKYQK